ncbi:MAG: transketolase [Deltaproteobacteria bacterium]|nr:transketolase [Deltaproteobacteria bacterium]
MPDSTEEKLEQLAVNTIRTLCIDAVQNANSGHPGMPMGMADCAFVLFHRFLRHDPSLPDWPGRDRFVLSAGHGSTLLYSLLHLYGYDLSLDDLKQFRQWESRTPGHPELGCTPGVETTTGPLGQGFASGVGMALAARLMSRRLNVGEFRPIDSRVFAIVSDGDLMEGVSSEAASLAGHLKLGNLIYLYDDNHISIEGPTDLTFSEDVGIRFEAYGWHVQHVDGHNRKAIAQSIKRATLENNRPSIICARTHIAYGSPGKQDSASSHGSPLGPDEVKATKEAMGWPASNPFEVPDQVRALFARRAEGLKEERQAWEKNFAGWREEHPDRASYWNRLFTPEIPDGLLDTLIEAAGTDVAATRALSGKVLQRAAEIIPGLIGGSADLAPSNKTMITDSPAIGPDSYSGRNIHFGVREHAMGSMLNGMAIFGGVIPYGGTFLVFADYMRPAIRLAALMKLGTIYVFTHDSIFVGEDGPTHQPIEHLASLRIIPDLAVFRPADPLETAAAWAYAIEHRHAPTALVLTRQKLPILDRPPAFKPEDVHKGAYVIVEEKTGAQEVVVATGSEVAPVAAAAQQLGIRAVSMPSREAFLAQPDDYQKNVIPSGWRVATVEASHDPGWHRLAGPDGLVIGIDRFGASAPGKVMGEKFGFTSDAILTKLSNWAAK